MSLCGGITRHSLTIQPILQLLSKSKIRIRNKFLLERLLFQQLARDLIPQRKVWLGAEMKFWPVEECLSRTGKIISTSLYRHALTLYIQISEVNMHLENKAVITNAIFTAIGVFGTYQAWKLGLWKNLEPAGGLFPFAIALVFTVLSLYSLVLCLFRVGSSPDESFGKILWKKLLLYAVTLVSVAFAVEPVGYITTIGIAFIFILRVLEKLTWLRTITVTIITLTISSLLFEKLLSIDLPHGFIW